MNNLGNKEQKWLKCAHVFFACLWCGGAVGLTMMNFFMQASDGMELYGINVSRRFIDDLIVVPGAIGSLLTGLIYSLFTGWGWFKHVWITIKWAINLFGVVFGTFWLGPWLNSLPPLSKAQGLQALSNPVYLHNEAMLAYWGSFQVATIVFAVFISVLRPWKARPGKTSQ